MSHVFAIGNRERERERERYSDREKEEKEGADYRRALSAAFVASLSLNPDLLKKKKNFFSFFFFFRPSKQLSSAGAANAFSLPTALGAPFRALFGSPASTTQKRVMILMSDTGGGHRASAEAIKAGFKAKYGDEFAVDSVDIWTEHTPWPFNQLPKSYGFLVKHAMLWRVSRS